MLEVTDDSGFLAVVVPAIYQGFVAEDWQLGQLLEHFRTQMEQRSLLVWGTGSEGCWKVDVRIRRSRVRGFREVSGPIRVVSGSVLVTNYESLTMAAQFVDVRLPEKHQDHLVVSVPNGDYCCRVAQMFDPAKSENAGRDNADFVLEFDRTSSPPAAWPKIPWFNA